jgi:hypothetical protein
MTMGAGAPPAVIEEKGIELPALLTVAPALSTKEADSVLDGKMSFPAASDVIESLPAAPPAPRPAGNVAIELRGIDGPLLKKDEMERVVVFGFFAPQNLILHAADVRAWYRVSELTVA